MTTRKVLLIEDEARLRHNIALLLERAGYRVTATADGREGLRYVRCERFDAVVTDLVMEAFACFELLECLATHLSDTPIIVMTGDTVMLSAAEAYRKGAYAYLAKPFAMSALKTVIEAALQKYSQPPC